MTGGIQMKKHTFWTLFVLVITAVVCWRAWDKVMEIERQEEFYTAKKQAAQSKAVDVLPETELSNVERRIEIGQNGERIQLKIGQRVSFDISHSIEGEVQVPTNDLDRRYRDYQTPPGINWRQFDVYGVDRDLYVTPKDAGF
jgi:hypothetical protein